MAHPYKDHAHKSHKEKAHSIGKINNLDIPVMHAVGENRAGGIHESTNTMQHRKQAGSPGMNRGGKIAAIGEGKSYPLTASSKGGIGRLQKNHAGKPAFKPIMRGD